MKWNFKKYIIVIAVKYMLFYLYEFSRHESVDYNLSNLWVPINLIYTVVILAVMPVSEVILCFYPIHLSLEKLKNQKPLVLSLAFLICLFITDICLSYWMSAESIEFWMFVKGFIYICLFAFIFKNKLF